MKRIIVATCLMAAAGARAQCVEAWLPGLGAPEYPGGVSATTWDPDGPGPRAPLFVTGGARSASNPTAVSPVGAWDGTTWTPLGSSMWTGPATSATVMVLAPYQSDLVAGGTFTTAGGMLASRIARWDGTAWSPLGTGLDGTPFALQEYNGGLIAGGMFGTAGGHPAASIARWNGVAWNPLGSGIQGPIVGALTVYNGDLIAGGFFTGAGGVPASSVARWDGSQWHAMGSGVDVTVWALRVHQGSLIAGGNFTGRIARWTGTNWTTLGGGVNSDVYCMTSLGQKLVVGGLFTQAGTVAASRVAIWDGATWAALGAGVWGAGPGVAPTVGAATSVGNTLYVCGGFDRAGTVPAQGIAAWNGAEWSRVAVDGFNGPVHALGEYQGDPIAGGTFTAIGNDTSASRIARWDGETWRGVGSGVNDQVDALIEYHGDLIACGRFTSASGVPGTGYLARWDSQEWSSTGFQQAAAQFPWPRRMTIYNDELVLLGDFFLPLGQNASDLARWDGAAWHALGNGFQNPSATPTDLAAFQGELVVAAWEAKFNDGLVWLYAWDGDSWRQLAQPFLGTWSTLVLCPYNDGLVLGGLFFNPAGSGARNILKWNGSGFAALGSGVSGMVHSMTVLDERLIVGGAFQSAGGAPALRIAAWNGASWSPLGSGLDQYPRALHVSDGMLHAGGAFHTAGGEASEVWARWGCERCYPDCDLDNVLNLADFGCFQTKFALGDPYADCNGDSMLNLADFGCFQTQFALGCP